MCEGATSDAAEVSLRRRLNPLAEASGLGAIPAVLYSRGSTGFLRGATLRNFRALPAQLTPRLFRSAALRHLTPAAISELASHGIELVIDLREASEIEQEPDELPPHTRTYVNIPLYQGDIPQAANIRDVYSDLLLKQGHQLALVLHTIGTNLHRNTLFHCRIGKDRTGLIAALLLELGGVDRATIAGDYAASQTQLNPEYLETKLAEINADYAHDPLLAEQARTLHLAAPQEAISSALETVATHFGSVAEFLGHHGVPEPVVRELAQQFTPSSVAEGSAAEGSVTQ